MRVTQKKLEANRRNAQKSTGPKTAMGKLISSRNATKHGLYAHDLILDSPALTEHKKVWDKLIESLYDEFSPLSRYEERLIHDIAQNIWLTRRAIDAESKLITKIMENFYNSPPDCDTSEIILSCFLGSERISRYEAALSQLLSQTIKQLVNHQRNQEAKILAKLWLAILK